MKPIDDILKNRFAHAMGLAFGAENMVDPQIKSADPKHADFQCNVAMPLGKRVGLPPREVAQRLLDNLKIEDVCETPAIAGPGFINLRLKKDFLASALAEAFSGENTSRAGVERVDPASTRTIVIDYSAPNVAKQMHVGHLRSTILGDTLARVLEFLGHTVIRQNHIGDFGTQFGMLILHLREKGLTQVPLTIEDLDRHYKEATSRFKLDTAFAEKARKTVVELQSGQSDAVELWNSMRVATRAHYTEIYQILGVTLRPEHERGESFYGQRLPLIIERIKSTLEFGGEGPYASAHSGTANDTFDEPFGHEPPEENGAPPTQDAGERIVESAEPVQITKPFAAYSGGAFCVFLPGYLTKDKRPFPMMLQKRDGGYPYSATDLAALYFRVQEPKPTPAEQQPLTFDWHADRVIYFIDARQSQHLAMLFDAFRAAQWDRNPQRVAAGEAESLTRVSLEHAPFGTMLGKDSKPFKTRSGDTVKLKELLAESIERASKVDAVRGAELSPEQRAKVDRAVGIGAVKYADLKQDRTTDYIFDFDRMLSLEGNTGPYLQMQYTRIQSIYRKGIITPAQVIDAKPALLLDHEAEAALAKKLLQFSGAVEAVARDLKPHHLCNYLYELCGVFARFFEHCPVLKAENEQLKMSRLLLCHYMATVLRIGLTNLLGIEVLDEM